MSHNLHVPNDNARFAEDSLTETLGRSTHDMSSVPYAWARLSCALLEETETTRTPCFPTAFFHFCTSESEWTICRSTSMRYVEQKK